MIRPIPATERGAASPGGARPRALALMLASALALGPAVWSAGAAEPPTIPSSFAEVAASARAATFVVRSSAADDVAGDDLSIDSATELGEDIQEDGWEPDDSLAALRNRTTGSGVIVDPRGIAVTSARVLLRANATEVVMTDGTPVNAALVGLDPRTDVAVLRLEGPVGFFPYVPFGDSDRVRVGDWVISVGAPLGLEGTVTAGVVSATPAAASASPFGSYLRTDAAMARGHAGGPLVNMRGELIGLGTALATGEGAYAVPSKTVRRIAFELLEKGRVSRPWLGATTQSLDAALARALGARGRAGALVSDVVANGPAATAGLRPGDVVIGVGTRAITSRLQLERAVSELTPGDVMRLNVFRDGRTRVVPATLGEEPDAPRPEAALTKQKLGVDVRPVNPTSGAVAMDVDLWSGAARAGIKPGDVIREVNGEPIAGPADLQRLAGSLAPGAPVLMRVQRGDVVLYVVVTASR